MKTNVVIVTGASSGIGQATALELLNRGCRVYDLSRHSGGENGIIHLDCDVSDEAQVRTAIASVFEREGRIDVLINNAGFGISGSSEFTRNEDAKRLLDVNLFGVVNGCRAVIPYMRRQGSGRIINLSSVAAIVPIPFQAWYSVSKAAVSTYTAALRNELRGFGISLCTVMPGDIRTGFTAAREKSEEGAEVYGERIRRSVAQMESDEQNGMPAAEAGKFIARLALKKRARPEVAIGFRYSFLSWVARILSPALKSRVIGLLYGGGDASPSAAK